MTTTKILRAKEKGMNRHWKNFVDKNYLGSHNLEKGEEMLLTIAKFEGEEIVETKENGKQPKPVLYFTEKVPKLIINMTNGNTLSQLYGTHPDGWIGKQIQLYAASVKAFGKVQDAIRIRDFVPKIAVDVLGITNKLEASKSLDELKKVWDAIGIAARQDAQLIVVKEKVKIALLEQSKQA